MGSFVAREKVADMTYSSQLSCGRKGVWGGPSNL